MVLPEPMFDEIALIVFVASISLLWLSTLGYVFILQLIVFLRPRAVERPSECPAIAVVIPTLDEESQILAKLEDMETCEYPKDRMKLIVVDGGSTDRTADLVREKISKGSRIELVCLNNSRSKVSQVNHVLANPGEDIIVFTDVDSRLSSSCIRELVRTIGSDADTALVGANVVPRSQLVEEHIHWHFLNHIWWLEGEVFASAGISGVCYAINRKRFRTLSNDAIAEDIHLGLDVSGRGHRVRTCPQAKAYELRVPQTIRDYLRFRRRRGASYANELVNLPSCQDPPLRWKLARWVRLWQFRGLPALGVVSLSAATLLAFSRYRLALLAFLALFGLSAVLQASLISGRSQDRLGFLSLAVGTIRFSWLTFVSLVALNSSTSFLGAIGGKEGRYDQSQAA